MTPCAKLSAHSGCCRNASCGHLPPGGRHGAGNGGGGGGGRGRGPSGQGKPGHLVREGAKGHKMSTVPKWRAGPSERSLLGTPLWTPLTCGSPMGGWPGPRQVRSREGAPTPPLGLPREAGHPAASELVDSEPSSFGKMTSFGQNDRSQGKHLCVRWWAGRWVVDICAGEPCLGFRVCCRGRRPPTVSPTPELQGGPRAST